VPVLIYAYAEGPPVGVAGVPGEFGSCTYCHSSGSGSGSVKVTFPNGLTYTAGATQHLIVTVADSAQQRWGFELTAHQAKDPTAQAGSFTPGSDGFTQTVCADKAFQSAAAGPCTSAMPLEYIEHTWNGTRPGQHVSADFAFDWTPPAAAAGNVIIYVTANAANADGKAACVEYISPTQINVQAPSDTAVGPVNVQVTNNGVTGDPVTAQLESASPTFFLWKSKYAVATRADYSWVGPPNLFPNAVPAKPGDVIILWGTGFATTNPAVPSGMIPATAIPGKVGNVVKTPSVLIGGITAKVISAVLSPQNAGLYQIAIIMPASVGPGDQSVVVESAGIHSPSGVYINVTQ